MRLLLINIFIGLFCSILANETSGFIKKLNGEASIIRDNQTIIAQVGQEIYSQDIIQTTRGSSIGIIFKDNTLISLGSNTKFIIEEYVFNPEEKKESFVGRITKGTLTGLTGLMSKINPDAMKLKAKSASIGIRGTHFVISVD